MKKDVGRQLAVELREATGAWVRAILAHQEIGSEETRAAALAAERTLIMVERRLSRQRLPDKYRSTRGDTR